MKKALRVLAPLLAAALACAGCGGGEGRKAKVHDDPSRAIEAGVGEEFIIRLDSNPTTGYSWRLAEPLDEKVVELVGSDYVADPGAEERVGAGGSEEWTFRAVGGGSATISLEYARAWEEEIPAAQTAAFKLNVD